MNDTTHFDRAAATRLALIAALVAEIFAYVVNGHDFWRSGAFTLLTIAAAWYGGKVIYAKQGDEIAHD